MAANARSSKSSSPRTAHESWRRITLAPGIELHLRADLSKPKPAELNQLLAHIATTRRKNIP